MHDIATFALAVLVRSGVVAGATLLLLPLLRRAPAHVRHALLVAALIACAVVPFFRSAAAEPPLSKAVALPPHSYIAQIIAFVYLALLAREIVSLALAFRTTRVLRASAIGDGPVYRSARVKAPVTIGAFRPMILIPADEAVPDEVIAHELAHVRRRDALLQSVLKIVTLPVACHPLVRMLERRAAVEREIACDEAAASAIGDRRRYARTLVAMAGRTAAQCGLAFGPADALEKRLRALRERGKRGFAGAAVAACAIGAVAIFIARLNVDVLPPDRDFSGRWILDRAASDLGPIVPRYDSFTNTLVHDASSLTSRQVRVRRGRTQRVNFRVETDGVVRPIQVGVVHARGRAGWSGDTLVMELSTPSGHSEVMRVALAPDRDTLITEGLVRDRGRSNRIRLIFRRDS